MLVRASTLHASSLSAVDLWTSMKVPASSASAPRHTRQDTVPGGIAATLPPSLLPPQALHCLAGRLPCLQTGGHLSLEVILSSSAGRAAGGERAAMVAHRACISWSLDTAAGPWLEGVYSRGM